MCGGMLVVLPATAVHFIATKNPKAIRVIYRDPPGTYALSSEPVETFQDGRSTGFVGGTPGS